VSIGSELVPSSENERRNWLPLVVAAVVVLSIAAVAILSLEHKNARGKGAVTPISAPLDSYAANLSLTSMAMSESGNLSGGGHLPGWPYYQPGFPYCHTVQVLFRDFAHEVAQNETLPLKSSAYLISMWNAPLKPFPPDLRCGLARLGRRLPGDSHPPRRDVARPRSEQNRRSARTGRLNHTPPTKIISVCSQPTPTPPPTQSLKPFPPAVVSFVPASAFPPTAPPSGSSARPAATCRSTAPSASTTPCSKSAARQTSPPRSPSPPPSASA
jgi:hypothetical protein